MADKLLAEFAQAEIAKRPGPKKKRRPGDALRMIGILNTERLTRVERLEIPLSAFEQSDEDD